MTDLVVRKIAWEFDGSVPFLWQPANPSFEPIRVKFCQVQGVVKGVVRRYS